MILIIEPQQAVSDLLATLCRVIGHQDSHQALSEFDALECLKNNEYQTIISCIRIDPTTGPKILLQSDLHRARLIFAVDCYDYMHHVQPVIDEGFEVSFIPKPMAGFYHD